MEKAFDLKGLEEKLAAKGMPVVEAMAEKASEAVFEWLEESVAMHPSAYIKFLLPVLMTIKPLAKAEIDKIDGQPG